ncbi:transposase [Bilophila wadsworthia]|uniref:transposase n=1 Tax=Bilophila wadsworthia TaxID=35833 RepID=UPI003B587D3F
MLTEGQVSDYKGTAILQHLLPDICTFLADGGYDASWLRESLKVKGTTVCIPPRRTRNIAFSFGKTRYKRRHLIGNTFVLTY